MPELGGSTALSSFPSGWFGLCLSQDLSPGSVLPKTFMGSELVVFRTSSGVPRVLDAHCPHLGAHLGHGGEVRGETIRCPFHGFCFDGEGHCTKTGYGTRPPPLARLRSWSVVEVGGVILAYHGPEAAPPWSLPSLEEEGWTRPRGASWTFAGRPQEIAENSVDLGHLTVVHRYGSPRPLGDFLFDGPNLQVRLEFLRPLPVFGRLGPAVRVEASISQHGLGFAVVHAKVASVGMENRFVVTSSSVDEKLVALHVTSSVRGWRGRAGKMDSWVPHRALETLLAEMTQVSFRKDVSQDIPLWMHKKPLERPAIAAGDGPLGKYRSWARQFYRG